MKIEGIQKLHALREQVYSALTDPKILQRCIPGCESLEKTADNTYAAILKAGVGAIKGTFKGEVRLEDMRPPEHYRIVVEGKGAVGFARGSADFDLTEEDSVTLITYSGELQIGGTIAGFTGPTGPFWAAAAVFLGGSIVVALRVRARGS